MKQNKLLLFFTNKDYRRMIFLWVKLRLRTLPGIRHFMSFLYGLRHYLRTRKMSSWERYIENKKNEQEIKENLFYLALCMLRTAINADPESNVKKNLMEYKQDVLSSELINDRELAKFKEWVQQITQDETDATKIQEVIDWIEKKE